MRQVPQYLILGDGRMARHMGFYLTHLGLPYLTFARKTHCFSELSALLAQSTHVLLLLRDDVIEDFIDEHLLDCNQTLVHFSGRLHTDKAYGAHPLMSFSHNLYEAQVYRQLWFILEENDKTFAELLPGLPNAFATLPAKDKALYHSLCVLSGNFTAILWQKFFNDLNQHWQIPSGAMEAYLKSVMNNILANPNTALTGPLVRNDQKTLDKNLAALENDPYQAVYQAFVTAYQQQEKK